MVYPWSLYNLNLQTSKGVVQNQSRIVHGPHHTLQTPSHHSVLVSGRGSLPWKFVTPTVYCRFILVLPLHPSTITTGRPAPPRTLVPLLRTPTSPPTGFDYDSLFPGHQQSRRPRGTTRRPLPTTPTTVEPPEVKRTLYLEQVGSPGASPPPDETHVATRTTNRVLNMLSSPVQLNRSSRTNPKPPRLRLSEIGPLPLPPGGPQTTPPGRTPVPGWTEVSLQV